MPRIYVVLLNMVGKRLVGLPMVMAWAVAVLAGMYGMVRYQMTPAAVASAARIGGPRESALNTARKG